MTSSTSGSQQPAVPSQQEIDARMAHADGVLGAAGHQVTDPEARTIIELEIAGEISGDEARRRLLALEDL